MLSGITVNNSAIISRPERPTPFYNNSIHYEENNMRRTNNNFRATTRGFSAQRHKQPNQPMKNQFKDPDVWETPPPLEKRQSAQKPSKFYNQNNNRSHQVRNVPTQKGKKNEG